MIALLMTITRKLSRKTKKWKNCGEATKNRELESKPQRKISVGMNEEKWNPWEGRNQCGEKLEKQVYENGVWNKEDEDLFQQPFKLTIDHLFVNPLTNLFVELARLKLCFNKSACTLRTFLAKTSQNSSNTYRKTWPFIGYK